jgi:hypothetical protein
MPMKLLLQLTVSLAHCSGVTVNCSFSCRTYSFKKHERINAFFNNFDEFLCEEAMWQISESIKPRGGKKTQ